MEKVKCECGHVNPHGTVLCESCGKFISDSMSKNLVDMRYEGSARRSQTYNRTIVDKIWNFFSSVKVGVWLIVITLIASALGTIYPQKMYIPPNIDPSIYYEQQYGITGKLYYILGLHNLYSSWWYMVLIASIGISLVICSLDRVVPLYRALKKQGVSRHPNFLKRQRLFSKSTVENNDEIMSKVKGNLEKRRYHVRFKNGNLLAEKGRFSRWGPYVNHIGLIIFLLGVMLRFFPGMYVDEVLWIREGETKVIPGTNEQYVLENNAFILEVYEKESEDEVFNEALMRAGSVAKNYQTNATLYKTIGDAIPGAAPELTKVKDKQIRVNEPLKFDNYAVYQVDYKLNEFKSMTFDLVEKSTEESLGTVTINLADPKPSYEMMEDYRVELMSYFPDFYFDSDGEPTTKTGIPNNPAFVFKMFTPENPEGEVSFVAIGQNIEPFGDNQYKMAFNSIDTRNVSALTVRKDLTLWIVGIGGAIFMIGVIQGMYWNHRRIWLQSVGDEVWIASHTNKNWYGLKTELKTIIKDTPLEEPIDQIASDNPTIYKEEK